MRFNQEYLFFESQGRQLFAALFLPDPEISATEGRVICSPFAGGKKSSQRMSGCPRLCFRKPGLSAPCLVIYLPVN
ncbi:MAG: hypothetical protein PHI28_06510 [Mangrovibacterium sp.]|nr:hypothetical protein [Mangrovibacterium sp.]